MKLYKFLIVNKSNSLSTYSYECGYANGYVAIPKNHPYYKKDYDDLDNIIIHGGLTLSEELTSFSNVPLVWLDENPENFEEYWVFGFDTRHRNDTLQNCNKEYVISEIESLEKQLLQII